MRSFIDANNGSQSLNNTEDFFEWSKPCFFEGCEELRKEMGAELNKAGPGCSSCRKRSIYKKYRAKVQEALKKV